MSQSQPKPVPIKEVTSFLSRWSVLANIVKSDNIREFPSKAGGTGKVWSILIADAAGDTIQAQFWGDSVDKFHKVLKETKSYNFSKGQVKISNKKYTTCPHNYQLTFNSDSIIEEVEADELQNLSMTRISYNTSGGIRGLKTNHKELIDAIGVVLSYKPQAEIKTKIGDVRIKREFWICDKSGHKIQVDVWGQIGSLDALSDDKLQKHPVCGIRNCRVQDYRGKVLNARVEDIILVPASEVDPKTLPQHHEELEWFQANENRLNSLVSLTEEYQGGNQGGASQSNSNQVRLEGEHVPLLKVHKTLKQKFMVDNDESGDVSYRCVVYPTRYYYSARDEDRLTCFYKGCAGCGRKWSEEIGCATCGEGVSSEQRWILQGVYADHSASKMNFRCFGKQAEQFLEMKADDVFSLKENGGDVSLIFDWDGLYAPIAVRSRVNLNHYNGEARLNPTIQAAERLTGMAFIDEAEKLLDELTKVHDAFNRCSDKGTASKRNREADDIDERTKRVKLQ